MSESKHTISACPMMGCDACRCDLFPFDKGGFPRRYYVACCWCEFRSPLKNTEPEAIAAHNALCDLIDKGRRYELVAAELQTVRYQRDKKAEHLDTAVRLLEERHRGPCDNKFWEGVTNFLALPAIAAIIDKQKEEE